MCYLRIARIVGSGGMRVNFVSLGIAVACSVIVAALVITFGRPVVLTASPSLSAASSTIQPAILTSGDGTVSRKPDLAVVGAAIESTASTASAAQADLAGKAAKLIARIKALGVPDADLNTSGYWIGPVYAPQGQSITGYRATEQLADVELEPGVLEHTNWAFGIEVHKHVNVAIRPRFTAGDRPKHGRMPNAEPSQFGLVLL